MAYILHKGIQAFFYLSNISKKMREYEVCFETTAAVSHSKISDNVLSALWNRDDLAEYCVDSIIPTEGGIQRLHAGVYREGIANFPGIRSTITVKQMESLFTQLIRFLDRPEVLRLIVWMIGHDERFAEMSLFDKLLSQSTIGKNKDFVHSNLTSVDVKVFLFTLSLWSNSIDCPARIPGRLRLRGNQISCWKAICQLINNSSTGDMNSVVFRTHVIDSVRLRCRVTSLTRLYGVFCWLEANVGDEDWLTLYATAIYEIITVPPSHRRRCDELFPDGFNDEEDLTVDDVDRIEEHVSRYLAAIYLSRGEFREAERRLIYAKSVESKDLLIKVYQKWVKDGRLNEQERDKLLNLVRELEARCRVTDLHENSPSPSSTDSVESEGDHDVAPAQSPRVQVDVSTNTPNRDVQTSLCDADESFFSVKSDLSDHTLSNCSPGRNNVSNADSQTFGNTVDGRKVEESKHTGNFTIDKQEKFHSASSTTTSRSVTVTVPEEREKSKEEPFPDIGGGTTSVLRKPTYEMSISAVSSISVIPSQATTSTPGTATVSNLPPIVANSPFGKFITSKEAAASFWKSGKPPKPVFGTVPPCISSSQQKPDQGNAANMSPVPNTCSSLKGTAQPPASGSICSGTSGTVQSPFSSERSQKNIAGSQDQVPISRTSSKFASNNFMQPHPDVSALEEEFLDDDESFCNNLIIELCKKQLERSPKLQSTNFADLGALQERMAQIAIQMQNTENQPRTSMPPLPLPPSPSIARTTPTEAQILSVRFILENRVFVFHLFFVLAETP
nr:unnamed protein product [Haemonchus contortus]